LRGNYNKLVEQCKELQKENKQYKKALTEIVNWSGINVIGDIYSAKEMQELAESALNQ